MQIHRTEKMENQSVKIFERLTGNLSPKPKPEIEPEVKQIEPKNPLISLMQENYFHRIKKHFRDVSFYPFCPHNFLAWTKTAKIAKKFPLAIHVET